MPVEQVELVVQCIWCKQVSVIVMTKEQYLECIKGEKPIQYIVPDLSADKCELLISRTCGACFDKMCGKDEY